MRTPLAAEALIKRDRVPLISSDPIGSVLHHTSPTATDHAVEQEWRNRNLLVTVVEDIVEEAMDEVTRERTLGRWTSPQAGSAEPLHLLAATPAGVAR